MNSLGPKATTLLGGLGLALVGLLELSWLVPSWFPISSDAQSVLLGGPAQALVIAVLLASWVILAFGFRGEAGIVGSSVLGRIALILIGLVGPIQTLVSFAFLSGGLVGTVQGLWIGTALQLLPIVAIIGAAVMVARAQVLDGFARWILVGVAAAEVLVFALSAVPNASQAYYIAVLFYLAALPPLLLAIAGVSFALQGRSAAIKQQLRTIYAKW